MVVGAFLGVMLMEWAYLQLLVAQFPRLFTDVRRPEEFMWAARAIAVLPALWIPTRLERPSVLFYWGIYITVLLPSAAAANYSIMPAWRGIEMLLSMLAGLLVIHLFTRLPLPRFTPPRASPAVFWGFVIGVSALFYAIAVQRFGLTLRLVGLEEMQAQRAAWAEDTGGALVSYAFSWQSSAINVFLIAYGLYTRKYWIVGLGVLGQLFFFAVAAQKVVIAVVVFLIAIYLLTLGPKGHFGRNVTWGTTLLFGIPALAVFLGYMVPNFYTYIVLFRTYMNNGVLSPLYYTFFHEYGFANFSEVLGVRSFVQNPYPAGYVATVSTHYFGFDAGANANLFADGYANLGHVGALIQSAALGVVIWLIDGLWKNKRLPMAFVCMALGSYVGDLANARVHTTLLGGGLAFAMLLVYLMPAREAPSE